MNKIKYLIILIVLFSSSCNFIKVTKALSNQKVVLKSQKVKFEIDDNRFVLKDSIDFFLDLGAPNIIFGSKLNNFKVSDSIFIGKLTNSNGKKIKNKTVIINELDNKLFNGKKIVFRVIDKKLNCENINGLLGADLFENSIIELNFENNFLKKINSLDSVIKQSYLELEVSDFDGYYFFVDLIIDNHTFPVKIDTGSPYDILMKKNDYNSIKSKAKIQNYFFKTKNVIDTLLVSNHQVRLDNKNENHLIISNNFIKRNLLGIDFMKHFNWILDYKSGKIFVKSLKETNDKPFIQDNKVIIEGNSLIYYQTKYSNSVSMLGKEIIEFDGNKINKNNICSSKKYLNSKNWDEINIKYK